MGKGVIEQPSPSRPGRGGAARARGAPCPRLPSISPDLSWSALVAGGGRRHLIRQWVPSLVRGSSYSWPTSCATSRSDSSTVRDAASFCGTCGGSTPSTRVGPDQPPLHCSLHCDVQHTMEVEHHLRVERSSLLPLAIPLAEPGRLTGHCRSFNSPLGQEIRRCSRTSPAGHRPRRRQLQSRSLPRPRAGKR